MSSWLERGAAVAYVPLGGPWVPRLLSAVPAAVFAALSYVVVDEMDRSSLSLAVAPWPAVDRLGRVRHAAGRVTEVTVGAGAWTGLTAARLPAELRDRPPRIGDAFAVLVPEPGVRRGWVRRVAGPVVDVTGEAREAARAAFYGAVATPLGDERAVAGAAVAGGAAEPAPVEPPAEWLAAGR